VKPKEYWLSRDKTASEYKPTEYIALWKHKPFGHHENTYWKVYYCNGFRLASMHRSTIEAFGLFQIRPGQCIKISYQNGKWAKI